MARSMLSYFERTWSESNVIFRTSRRGHRSWYVSFEAFEHEFGHEYLDLASNLTNVICSEPHVAAGAEVVLRTSLSSVQSLYVIELKLSLRTRLARQVHAIRM